MTFSRFTAAVAAAILGVAGAISVASAATINLSGNADHMLTLYDVDRTTLTFSVPTTGGYANSGGYVKWSTRDDGRQDHDGPWTTCLECGYHAGGWYLVYKPGNAETTLTKDLIVDFGRTRDIVHVWVKSTHGTGSLTYAAADPVVFPVVPAVDDGAGGLAGTDVAAPASPPGVAAPVPLPAAGWLLIAALGAVACLRRRRAA